MRSYKMMGLWCLVLAGVLALSGCPKTPGPGTTEGESAGEGENAGEGESGTTTPKPAPLVIPTVDVGGGALGGDLYWGDETWYQFEATPLAGYDIRVRGMFGLVVSIFKEVPVLDAKGKPTSRVKLEMQAMEITRPTMGYADVDPNVSPVVPAFLQEVRFRNFVAAQDDMVEGEGEAESKVTYRIRVETYEQIGAPRPEDSTNYVFYEHFPFNIEINPAIDFDTEMKDPMKLEGESAGEYLGGRLEANSEEMIAFAGTSGERVYIDLFCEDPFATAQVLWRYSPMNVEFQDGNVANGQFPINAQDVTTPTAYPKGSVVAFVPEFTGTFLLDLMSSAGNNIFDTFSYEALLVQDDHANWLDNHKLATRIALDANGKGSATGTLYAWDDDAFVFEQRAEGASYVEIVWANGVEVDWAQPDGWMNSPPWIQNHTWTDENGNPITDGTTVNWIQDAALDQLVAQVTDQYGNIVENKFYVRLMEEKESYFPVVNATRNVSATGYTINVTPAPTEPRLTVTYGNVAPAEAVPDLVVVPARESAATFTLNNEGGLPLTWHISKWTVEGTPDFLPTPPPFEPATNPTGISLSAYTGTLAAGESQAITVNVSRPLLQFPDLSQALSVDLAVTCDNLFGAAGFPVAGSIVPLSVHPEEPVLNVVDGDGNTLTAQTVIANGPTATAAFVLRNLGDGDADADADMEWTVTMPDPNGGDPIMLDSGAGLGTYLTAGEVPVELPRTVVFPTPTTLPTTVTLTVAGWATFDGVRYEVASPQTVAVTVLAPPVLGVVGAAEGEALPDPFIVIDNGTATANFIIVNTAGAGNAEMNWSIAIENEGEDMTGGPVVAGGSALASVPITSPEVLPGTVVLRVAGTAALDGVEYSEPILIPVHVHPAPPVIAVVDNSGNALVPPTVLAGGNPTVDVTFYVHNTGAATMDTWTVANGATVLYNGAPLPTYDVTDPNTHRQVTVTIPAAPSPATLTVSGLATVEGQVYDAAPATITVTITP